MTRQKRPKSLSSSSSSSSAAAAGADEAADRGEDADAKTLRRQIRLMRLYSEQLFYNDKARLRMMLPLLAVVRVMLLSLSSLLLLLLSLMLFLAALALLLAVVVLMVSL